jgi:hypothetical protein
MSFPRHEQIYQSDVVSGWCSGAGLVRLRPETSHRLDESAPGYSSASCTPALLASASPGDCYGEASGRNCQPPLARGWGNFSWRNGEISVGVDTPRNPSASHQPTPGTEGCRHFIYLPQSFIGIVWHQQLVAAVVTVGVVAAVGAGADAVRVSTNHKFRMVIMVVDLL